MLISCESRFSNEVAEDIRKLQMALWSTRVPYCSSQYAFNPYTYISIDGNTCNTTDHVIGTLAMLVCKGCDLAFVAAIEQFIGVPYLVDSTSHDFVIDEVVLHSRSSGYPILKNSRKPKVKQHLTDTTFKFILERNFIIHVFHSFFYDSIKLD